MNTIMRLSTLDLAAIREIVLENKISAFDLIKDNSSGIGYTIDIQFESEMNGRDAIVRIPVRGTKEW
jgi:hypothetical protein